MSQRPVTTIQPFSAPITIDLGKLLEHGNTPAAIILSMAVFTVVLLKSFKRSS